nr:3-oxoacyl-[acyl-carrier-protein] reductase, putative [Tanacetum cinerariifolium]
MDVTDEAQVQQAVRQGQYATNVFGVLNVVRAVLPTMRQQRAGYLINISSIDAHGAFPGWGVYGSTKFALE